MSAATIAIVGDGSAGKSSLIAQLIDNGFNSTYKQTVGCDFYEKAMKMRDLSVSVRIWDIGGQSISSSNFKQYVSNADAILLVYDVTKRISFDNIEDWNRILKKHTVLTKVYLVGNKIDMYGIREVSELQHKNSIQDYKYKGGFLISAKTGENVMKSFYKVASVCVGTPLTESELNMLDTALKVQTKKSDEQETRTAFADQIEEEDRLAALEYERSQQQACCVIA